MINIKAKTQKWNDEACAAACTEMNRMRSLLAELEKEMAAINNKMNTDGRSINWGTVGDMKRTNELLTRALRSTENESDALMYSSIDLNIKS